MPHSHPSLTALFLAMILAAGCSKPASTGNPTKGDAATASSIPGRAMPSMDDGKMKVEITKGVVTINGTVLPLPTDLETVEKILGKPTRIGSGYQRQVYWKELGIKCAQEADGKKRIVSIGFYFRSFFDVDENYSSKDFDGKVTLEGHVLAKDSQPEELAKAIPGLKKNGDRWAIEGEKGPNVYFTPHLDKLSDVTIAMKLRD